MAPLEECATRYKVIEVRSGAYFFLTISYTPLGGISPLEFTARKKHAVGLGRAPYSIAKKQKAEFPYLNAM